jgi:hypothetical protein
MSNDAYRTLYKGIPSHSVVQCIKVLDTLSVEAPKEKRDYSTFGLGIVGSIRKTYSIPTRNGRTGSPRLASAEQFALENLQKSISILS